MHWYLRFSLREARVVAGGGGALLSANGCMVRSRKTSIMNTDGVSYLGIRVYPGYAS